VSFIDDRGRLFGRVNVIDAAVVAVVALVVLAAGGIVFASLIDDRGTPESGDATDDRGTPESRYATVDLGEQSPAVASRFSAGDASGDGDIAVTDVYVGPGTGDNVSVVARVRVNGTLTPADAADERTFEYRDAPVRRGDQLAVTTSVYGVNGTVLSLAESGASLDTATLPVVVETSLPAATRDAVSVGDTFRLDDRRVATVEETEFPPVGNETTRTDLVGLTLHTVNRSGGTYFGGTELRLDESIEFSTSRYAFTGNVTRWGSSSPAGERAATTATITLRDVDPDVADDIRTGAVERRGDAVTATVTDRRTAPATVVLTSDDGNIYEREHPRNVDVTLTVDLRTRRTDDGLVFHGRPLRAGTDLTLRLETVTVDGTVTDLDE